MSTSASKLFQLVFYCSVTNYPKTTLLACSSKYFLFPHFCRSGIQEQLSQARLCLLWGSRQGVGTQGQRSLLFVCGYTGSSSLCSGFLLLWPVEVRSSRGAQASHRGGCSCCPAQTPSAQVSVAVVRGLSSFSSRLCSTGSVVVVHRLSWASLIAQLIKNPPQCRRSWFDSWVGKICLRRD